MKRLAVGLLVVGLLAVAGPASAQGFGGMADPLGLIASGAIAPIWGAGNDFSFLEISSPVGANTAPATHLIFFNSACTRTESVNLPLTVNDVAIPLVAGSGGLAGAINGLVAIGGSAVNGIDLVSLQNPIHVKVHRFNLVSDYVRVYNPIAALNADESKLVEPVASVQTWSPLRSGATFFTPVLGGAFSASLEFACPTSAVFDAWLPATAPLIPTAPFTADTFQGRVFDDGENFRRDISTSCNCLTVRDVAGISTVYSDATLTTNGYFTELLGVKPAGGTGAFVGWQALVFTSTFVPGGQLDDHSRLNNANNISLGGTLTGAR